MTIIYFVLAALALGFLILIHELGHLLAAKAVGMTVESFSIGFGPALVRKTVRGIEYRIGVIPFGGYVRIKGMDKSNKDKSIDREKTVYDIPGGFFSKSPWKRIFVLAAGPLANILAALVAFGILYVSGGRTKSFSEHTSIVGWVHPSLERQGLHLGDQIFFCNGQPYSGSKMAFSSSLLDRKLLLQGEHPAYFSETGAFSLEAPFNPSLEGVPCLGASYLLYRGNEPLPEKSPLIDAGLSEGDRLVWMDGELVFSGAQIAQMLNEKQAFLRVERQGKIIFVRHVRVLAGDLHLTPYYKNELIDCQYEAGLKGKWASLHMLPYIINSDGFVESKIGLLNKNWGEIDYHLELGDRIIAVDGIPVISNADILRLVQDHRVSLIFQRMSPKQLTILDQRAADQAFINSYDMDDLLRIAESVGEEKEVSQLGEYRLVTRIQPRPWAHIYSEELLNKQRSLVSKIRDEQERRHYLERIEAEKQRISLGIPLKDLAVQYNPTPLALIEESISDSLRTVRALGMGRLSPQWLSGPVGIVRVLHTGWSMGVPEALAWIGLISMNLAVLNLLPIPVLDGGYILLCLWEICSRRRLNMRLIEKGLIPFMILLILFFVFLTLQDLSRVFIG
ncbi:site-2 protease family protein [Chlamydia sp.]|uniref:site-2 protease family protein n=1 Tax=Chlamydia sp. TaxID=35827 RepID=UPI0025BBA91B|nr:site-2 protease family protein [Chlamydia sp.]MBQ8498406.1 site-2 protease family protein [Chlamydia sp.]